MSFQEHKPSKKLGRCGATKKVCFKSIDAALSRAADIMESGKARCRGMRGFKCSSCGFYHLTSDV
jgi:hypothetical protein